MDRLHSRRRVIASLALSFAGGLVACQPAVALPSPSSTPTSPIPTATTIPPTPVPSASVPATATASPATPTPPPTSPPTTVASPSPTTIPSPTGFAFDSNPERLQPGGPPHDPGPLDWAQPGPYLGAGFGDSKIAGFNSSQPLVTTYYFYWDDLTDPARREANRKFHPVDQDHYTFLDPASHRRQFEDMQKAGIDFALPVYWGEPGHPGRAFNPVPGHNWSTEGIPPMVTALDQMAAAGHLFKIGMFYDTTILANADLTTPNGLAYFYVNARDFFSRIPPRHWATIDDKPIVWLYDTQWVAKYDQATFRDLSERFARDFAGRRPYVVRELQWYGSKGVQPSEVIKTDNVYGWGAALSGYNPDNRLGVAEVGPGFDTTGDCGGRTGADCVLVDREKGAYYARQLAAALRSARKIIAIETWNEFDEGTGIGETVEFGRTYIDLTRRYADAFHANRRALT